MPYQREKINTEKNEKYYESRSHGSAAAALIYSMIQFIFCVPFHLFSRVISVVASTIIYNLICWIQYYGRLHNACGRVWAVWAANKCVRMTPVTYRCSQFTCMERWEWNRTTQSNKFNENGNSTNVWVIVWATFKLFPRPFCALRSFFGRLA